MRCSIDKLGLLYWNRVLGPINRDWLRVLLYWIFWWIKL